MEARLSTFYAVLEVALWAAGGGVLGVLIALALCILKQRREGDYSTYGGMVLAFQWVVGPMGGLIGVAAGLAIGMYRFV